MKARLEWTAKVTSSTNEEEKIFDVTGERHKLDPRALRGRTHILKLTEIRNLSGNVGKTNEKGCRYREFFQDYQELRKQRKATKTREIV